MGKKAVQKGWMPLTLRRLPSTRTELGNFKAILTAGAPSCPRSHSQFYKVIIMDIFEKCIKLGDFKVILTAGAGSCTRSHSQFYTVFMLWILYFEHY